MAAVSKVDVWYTDREREMFVLRGRWCLVAGRFELMGSEVSRDEQVR